MALPDLLLQLKDVHFEETDLKGHFTVNFWSFAILLLGCKVIVKFFYDILQD